MIEPASSDGYGMDILIVGLADRCRPLHRHMADPAVLFSAGYVSSADAVGLVEQVVAVFKSFLSVLVDRNGDRLDVLAAVALARRPPQR
jgi:hypothetical protein